MKNKKIGIVLVLLCICIIWSVYAVTISVQNRSDTDVSDREQDICSGQDESATDADCSIQDLATVPQCIWGTWVVTAELHGQFGWGECCNVPQGITIEFSPTGFSFQGEYKEVAGYSCSIIAIADTNEYYRETGKFGELGMEGDYYLLFSLNWDDWKEEIGYGWEYILISGTEMVIPEARSGMYRMEKIGEYDGPNDKTDHIRMSPYRSMCYGIWEITEQLGESCQSVKIGDELDMREDTGYIVSCRIVDRSEERVDRAAEWLGLGDGNKYMVICYFKEDYFWDYMIMKDGMTAVLVKGEYMYQIIRISDPEEDCIYDEIG